MPLIRLRRTQDFADAAVSSNFMQLEELGFDGFAYNFEWLGANGILPYEVLQETVQSTEIQGRDLRVVIMAPDVPDNPFWVPEDLVNIMTSRQGRRLGVNGAGVPLGHTASQLGVLNPFDTLCFDVRPKAQAFDITFHYGPITNNIGSSQYRLEI